LIVRPRLVNADIAGRAWRAIRKAEAFIARCQAKEFLHCQRVAAARIFEAQQAASDGYHHFRLAPDDPRLVLGGGNQQGERTAIGSIT